MGRGRAMRAVGVGCAMLVFGLVLLAMRSGERRTSAATVESGVVALSLDQDLLALAQARKRTGVVAMVAVVIDDLGIDQAAARRAVALPAPLTFAFLPYGTALTDLADAAAKAGHEVVVHMPMAPHSRSVDPGPNVLRPELADSEFDRRLALALAAVPGHVGLNNHMGSRFTESPAAMRRLMHRLSQRGIYFLDSRTTAASAGREAAAALGVRYAERDVFLDNEREEDAIAGQLAVVEALARRHGTAIAIGHPHPQTLAALSNWVPTLAAKGIRLVPVSTIIAVRRSPDWRLRRDRHAARG